MRHGRIARTLLTAALTLGGSASLSAQQAPAPARATPATDRVTADGTVSLDGVRVPLSDLQSPEAQAFLRHLMLDKPFGAGPPLADIAKERARQDGIMHTFLDPMLKRYQVKVSEERIAGIRTDVVVPAAGIDPRYRDSVLINLHGGGFTTGAHTASLVESVPLAATMRIKVISIDYRMAPEAEFPAASQDVAAVYREVLKRYDPRHIVIYGCSAGGLLTAETIAWFAAHDLPNPAAIGVFCAPLGPFFAGDASVLALPLLGGAPRPLPPRQDPARPAPSPFKYLANARADDPLAYPLVSPATLAKFPPTLFISGTRSFEFSAALNSNNQLAKAGVETRFHAWDGMFHGFFYNSELPESREAYTIMKDFFAAHLAD